eukprot:CAMPEP_0116564282 /NCGR_PEP_ID=MMETSP0397-20121206/13219_1 /TAXON_ID=216820 /ORGANISM="Cyclophora tenuis, Strain ECT3854" /LENGTH=125 /DNA_ID=CAMNT_0004090853 /DNA_START=85 /DNA_END=462 /DNA_ORIENTATION=-
MSRFFAILLAVVLAVSVNAFTAPATTFVTKTATTSSSSSSSLRMDPTTEEKVDIAPSPVKTFIERGVSVDQDGQSNVWALEPKVEIENKSNEEKTQSALLAAGGLAIFAVFAGVVLTNLPDPNQF